MDVDVEAAAIVADIALDVEIKTTTAPAAVDEITEEFETATASASDAKFPQETESSTASGANGKITKEIETAAETSVNMEASGAPGTEASLSTEDDGVSDNLAEKENTRLKNFYFNDGLRKIDFVMTYKQQVSKWKLDRQTHYISALTKVCSGFDDVESDVSCSLRGLDVEMDSIQNTGQNKDTTCFMKVHVPFEVLRIYAEKMRMKLPLNVKLSESDEENSENEQESLCGRNLCVKSLTCDFQDPLSCDSHPLYGKDCNNTSGLRAEFENRKFNSFKFTSEGDFLTDTLRSQIAYHIMNETKYGERRYDVGIDQMLKNQIFESVYPLHSGNIESNSKSDEEIKRKNESNLRGYLYENWARPSRWYKYQPLDAIRAYFGDKIALYFAWISFYTQALIYPSVAGIIIMIYSAATVSQHPPVQEICDPSYPSYVGDFVMCPKCDKECGYWNLSSSCLATELTHIVDNNATIFFAIFMSLWATLFLELWKRRQFKLNYEWSLADYDASYEVIRPEYGGAVRRKRVNPVTRKEEPFLSAKGKCLRSSISGVTIVFSVLLVFAAVIVIIVYRTAMFFVFSYKIGDDHLEDLGALKSYATPRLLTTTTGSLLSLIVVMLLDKGYGYIGYGLTKLELPRTQKDFEESYTFKIFCFEFVNSYSYLFYLAFFKQALTWLPPEYNYLEIAGVNARWEECEAGGCMYELSIQLAVTMIGKRMLYTLWEVAIPWLRNKWRYKPKRPYANGKHTQMESDHYTLQPSGEDYLAKEYLKMVMQFGFATLFAAGFPLAPAFALLNNVFEIRLDAHKMITKFRRPVSRKCSSIGIWYQMLDFLGTLAVITNAFTIAFTSQTIPKLVYYYHHSLENYPEYTTQGYTNNSLSIFDVNDFKDVSKPLENPGNVQFCR